MPLNLRVFVLIAIVGGLLGVSTPGNAATTTAIAAAPLEVIQWAAEDGADWYRIEIRQSGTDHFAQWMPAADVCEGTTCSFDPSVPMPFGLDAGGYQVFIRWWDADAQQIRLVERQDRTSIPEVSINPVNGRVEVTIPNDPRFDWVQIFFQSTDGTKTIKHFNRTNAPGWYERNTEMTCGASNCTILTQAYPNNDRYDAYFRYWNPEDKVSSWSAPIEFRVNADRQSAVNNLTVTVDNANKPTITWSGRSNFAWYRIYLGAGGKLFDRWMLATDLGCNDGGTCTISPDVTVPGGRIAATYVLGWGPGGTNGGLNGSGWAVGEPYFVPGSNNAFLMQNDLLVFEAESAGLTGDWTFRTSFGGFTGNGYITWRHGDTNEAIDRSQSDVITYIVKIPEAGTYRMMMRATSPDPGDLYNDIFFRVLGEGIYAEAVDPSPGDGETDYVNMGQDWFKVYNNSTEQWRWQASHVDNDAHEVFLVVDQPGEFAFQISGRSNQFRIDRFVFYDEATVTQNQATALTNPQSPRG